MVEISKKYKLKNTIRFGSVNWIGLWTLYKREVLRFLNVWVQTLLSPIVTSLLFLLVLSVAIGNNRGDVLGFPFITFLAPGLIAMQVIQQSFSHSSSSFMIGKIQGNIVDILYAPLSAGEVTTAVALASTTRSFMIGAFSLLVFYFLVDIEIKSYFSSGQCDSCAKERTEDASVCVSCGEDLGFQGWAVIFDRRITVLSNTDWGVIEKIAKSIKIALAI